MSDKKEWQKSTSKDWASKNVLTYRKKKLIKELTVKYTFHYGRSTCVCFCRSRVRVTGVWISRASKFKWPPPLAKSASPLSSGSSHPLSDLCTSISTCPCALEGTVFPMMTRTPPPICPRGLEGLGKWFSCVQSASLTDLWETVSTGAPSGLWPT